MTAFNMFAFLFPVLCAGLLAVMVFEAARPRPKAVPVRIRRRAR